VAGAIGKLKRKQIILHAKHVLNAKEALFEQIRKR